MPTVEIKFSCGHYEKVTNWNTSEYSIREAIIESHKNNCKKCNDNLKGGNDESN